MTSKSNVSEGFENDRELMMSGWFHNHPTTGAALPMTPEVEAFVGTIWPMSTAYYSPLNPLWLMQVFDLRLLARRPCWIVRDGLVPLTWFFHRHPHPPTAMTRLYVDQELAHVVPDAWHSHVGTYRLHSEAKLTTESRSVLIGLASDSYASLSFVRDRSKMIAQFEGRAGVKDFDIYLPTRWSQAAAEEERDVFHAQYFGLLFSAFPDCTRALTRAGLMGTFDSQNLRVWDLNEKLLIADNSLVHSLLRKGGQWPLAQPAGPNEVYRRLSNFHGYVTNDEIHASGGDQIQKSLRKAKVYHEVMSEVSQTAAFKDYPWPTWFAGWVRAAAEGEKPIIEKEKPERKSRQTVKKTSKRQKK